MGVTRSRPLPVIHMKTALLLNTIMTGNVMFLFFIFIFSAYCN